MYPQSFKPKKSLNMNLKPDKECGKRGDIVLRRQYMLDYRIMA